MTDERYSDQCKDSHPNLVDNVYETYQECCREEEQRQKTEAEERWQKELLEDLLLENFSVG